MKSERYKHVLLFVVIVCSLCKCKPDNNVQDSYVLSVDIEKAGKQSVPAYKDMVESMEYIPLETAENTLVGDVRQLIVSKEKYFISDDNAVKCFSSDGEYLFDVGRKGRGLGEYSLISSFSCDSCYVYIFDQNTLFQYDINTGTFIKHFVLPNPAYQVAVNKGIVYCFQWVPSVSMYCFSIDDPSNIVELFSQKANEAYQVTDNMFLESGKRLLYADALRGLVFELFDQQMKPLFQYNIGKDKMVPEEFLKRGIDFLQDCDDMMTRFVSPYISNDIITFYYSINMSKHQCYVNTKNWKFYDFDVMKWIEQERDFPQEILIEPICSDGVYLYDLLSPTYIEDENFDTIPLKYQTYTRLKNVDFEDNVIIRKIKLKDDFLK